MSAPAVPAETLRRIEGIGITERLCIGAFLVWVGVLAVALLRAAGAWAEQREVHA